MKCPKCSHEFDPVAVRQETLRGLPPVTDGPRQKEYSAGFEAVWAATGKRGSKFDANKAWDRAGKPGVDVIRPAWEAYLKSDRPVRLGAIQDLSTWLNKRGYAQAWMAVEARCAWHLDQRNKGLKSHVPRDTCPDCREDIAAVRIRPSEPTAVGVPNYLRSPPPAWTEAQKAEFAAANRAMAVKS